MMRNFVLACSLVSSMSAGAASPALDPLSALGDARPSGLGPKGSKAAAGTAVEVQTLVAALPGSKTIAGSKVAGLSVTGVSLGDSETKVEARMREAFPKFEIIRWERRIKGAPPDLGLMAYRASKGLVVASEAGEYVRVSFHAGKAWYIEHRRTGPAKEAAGLNVKLVEAYGTPSWQSTALGATKGVAPSTQFNYKWLYAANLQQYAVDDGTVSGCSDYTVLDGYAVKPSRRCGAALIAESRPKEGGVQFTLRLYDNRVQTLRQQGRKAK